MVLELAKISYLRNAIPTTPPDTPLQLPFAGFRQTAPATLASQSLCRYLYILLPPLARSTATRNDHWTAMLLLRKPCYRTKTPLTSSETEGRTVHSEVRDVQSAYIPEHYIVCHARVRNKALKPQLSKKKYRASSSSAHQRRPCAVLPWHVSCCTYTQWLLMSSRDLSPRGPIR